MTIQTPRGKAPAAITDPAEICRISGDRHQENQHSGGERERREPEKGANERRHSFPAFESQENRIGMTGHHGQRGEARPRGRLVRQFRREPDRGESLGRVQQQCGNRGRPIARSQHVGRADIAAADGSHVLSAGEFHQHIPERDAADQVRDHEW